MIGGPLGALLGAAAGHQFDKQESTPSGKDRAERLQTAFFTATFSVLGHVSKADGQVSRDEIRLAAQVMDHLSLSPHLRELARHLFSKGKDADFPLDDVLKQLAGETRSRNLLRMFVEFQVFAAYADGQVHHAERQILERISAHLGFNASELRQIEALVQAEIQHDFSGPRTSQSRSLAAAYTLLGIADSVDNAAVKRAYRRLMSQHHPDKLVSQGLPEEMMKLATAKAQEIKGAYECVKKSRGMR
jgi:DnaJ like chaperone protein